MERLTHERSNGIKTGYWSPDKKEELVNRLAEYENTGLTPAQIREIDKLYLALCRELTELRKRQQWIPVEESLPETEELVLVQVSGKPRSNVTLCDAFQMAQYDIEEGWIIEEYPEWEDAKPIAWMPLPEPYKVK